MEMTLNQRVVGIFLWKKILKNKNLHCELNYGQHCSHIKCNIIIILRGFGSVKWYLKIIMQITKWFQVPLTDMQEDFWETCKNMSITSHSTVQNSPNQKMTHPSFLPSFHRERMGSHLLVETSRNPECPKVNFILPACSVWLLTSD